MTPARIGAFFLSSVSGSASTDLSRALGDSRDLPVVRFGDHMTMLFVVNTSRLIVFFGTSESNRLAEGVETLARRLM